MAWSPIIPPNIVRMPGKSFVPVRNGFVQQPTKGPKIIIANDVALLAPGFNGALDPYSTSLTGLWSSNNRLLTSFTGGNLLKARESTGNTERLIPYLSNGVVDVATEASFAGAGNLFESQLLGQISGIPDFTQASASAQPQINTSTGIVTYNGSSQYLKGSQNACFNAGSGSITVMVRIKVASWVFPGCIFGSGDLGSSGSGDWYFFVRNSGATNNVAFECHDSTGTFRTTSQLTMPTGAWITIWGYLDVTNQKFGIAYNGNAATETAATWILGNPTQTIVPQIAAGYNGSYGLYPFTGSISHVAIWKRALGQTERANINTALAALP